MLNESSAFVKSELQRGQIFIFFERKISEKTESQERQAYIKLPLKWSVSNKLESKVFKFFLIK